ncbi:MAG: glycosyltransferase [Gammaproteobacteria bacterium]|nr:glycosyltransferase [Gammaproteobacteria bacterium]
MPTLGRVKTRLIPELGAEGALAAHEELLRRTIRRLTPFAKRGALELWLDTAPGQWRCEGLAHRVQTPGDLGARMSFAVRDITAAGRVAVVVGADCPLLDAAYVRAALVALNDHDVVLGPAEDGGYALIAMAKWQPELFSEVRWSTRFVLTDTRERARSLDARWCCLNTLWDVDEPADWRRYQQLQRRELRR